ncbi:Fic family protein [Herbiconiux sp. 11R-BC]|uniref:Fic family protein n=1 Tax=Herbiconiux sp. 11R-BC TaxID=3111637 RepID=UPI003C0C83A5
MPPPPETVDDYLDDLLAFANRDDLPPLTQAAIVHAQFESIHPFTDGNGRIGRALIHAVLRRRDAGGCRRPHPARRAQARPRLRSHRGHGRAGEHRATRAATRVTRGIDRPLAAER